MQPPPVYLDNNATTRPLPEVVEAVSRALEEHWHNPSSTHRPGQAARAVVERARRSVASLIGATPPEITFTSGATEALDTAIRGTLAATPPHQRLVITTPVEHEAVHDCLHALRRAGRIDLQLFPVDRDGRIVEHEIEPLLDRLATPPPMLIAQWANNETGVIQPIAALGQAARQRGIPFIVDGTQWVGKAPTDVDPLKATPDAGAVIDMLAFSAHKFHGPKGIGALYTRRGVSIHPTIHGIQERQRRGGTENVPGIAGFGVAAEHAHEWLADHAEREQRARNRDRFEAALLAAIHPLVPDAHINAAGAPRIWNTTNLALPGIEAEPLVLALSEQGVAISAGAACASGSMEPSRVLTAMGLTESSIAGSIRLSTSRLTTHAELDRAVDTITQVLPRFVQAGRHSARPDTSPRPTAL